MHSEAQQAGIRKTLTFLLGAIALMVGLIVSNYLHRDTTLSRESAAKLGFIRFEQPRSVNLPMLSFQDGSPVSQDGLCRWLGFPLLWFYRVSGYLPDNPRSDEQSFALKTTKKSAHSLSHGRSRKRHPRAASELSRWI